MRHPKFKPVPEAFNNRNITACDLDIIEKVERYELIPTSYIIQLLRDKYNERVIHRRLQGLYHRQLVDRFSLARVAGSGEMIYYLHNPAALELLVSLRNADREKLDWQRVRQNARRPYSAIHDRKKAHHAYGRLDKVEHELMISRMHFMLEMAAKKYNGNFLLTDWRQGRSIHHSVEVDKLAFDREKETYYKTEGTEILPNHPDAFFTIQYLTKAGEWVQNSFLYEADRMRTREHDRIRRKFRANFHFIVKRNLHRQAYGVEHIRAVLIESIDADFAQTLLEQASHPVVCGPAPSPLFWATASDFYIKPQKIIQNGKEHTLPHFLHDPNIVLNAIWLPAGKNELVSLLQP